MSPSSRSGPWAFSSFLGKKHGRHLAGVLAEGQVWGSRPSSHIGTPSRMPIVGLSGLGCWEPEHNRTGERYLHGQCKLFPNGDCEALCSLVPTPKAHASSRRYSGLAQGIPHAGTLNHPTCHLTVPVKVSLTEHTRSQA